MQTLSQTEIESRLEELGEPQGVALHVYLPSLDDTAIKELLTIGTALRETALALGCWLGVIAAREWYRRNSVELIEAVYPSLPVDWDSDDYCEALKRMDCIRREIRDGGLSEFFEKLNRLLVAIVCERLQRQSH